MTPSKIASRPHGDKADILDLYTLPTYVTSILKGFHERFTGVATFHPSQNRIIIKRDASSEADNHCAAPASHLE